MKYVDNNCINCPSMGMPCMGDICNNKETVIFKCDNCGVSDTLYKFEGQELCIDCISDELEIVEGSDN